MIDLLLEHGSYAGIIILLILTGAGLPIPEEVFVIFAGVASRHGVMHPGLAFGACLTGALLGDLLTYGIGHHFGRNIVREHHWFTRYVTPDREQKMEQLIHRHGPWVFFFARFMVGLRSPIYLTAGIMNVPFRRFILVDTVCASSVIGLFFGLSYLFADRIEAWWPVIRRGEVWGTVVGVLVVLALVLFFYARHRRRKRAAKLTVTVTRAATLEPIANGSTKSREPLPAGSPRQDRDH
ncbi:MAG TPA: DedA family protein [Pirellulales bacterium]|jgi:membrane protein DedA with SNARE-associated domain|nr:DedA family protein [Pirellulales bacterium]